MSMASNSGAIISQLQTSGGWGNGNIFQIDFSINMLCDPNGTAPKMAFTKNGDFADPDCDTAPIPLPAGGHVEGESGYACTQGGDCHLLVIEPKENRLYESWETDLQNGMLSSGCLAIWDTSSYSDLGRGDQCTSADAGGFPIAALLFDADEVASGTIRHAIRFILPNSKIQRRTYVRPATHATNSSGASSAVPYGAHLRISDSRIAAVLAALPNAYARTVAQALHDYGMFLSDGGNIALTAADDGSTTAKWDNNTDDRTKATGLGARDLSTIKVTDFEVVDSGSSIPWNGNCNRTAIAQ